MDAQESVVSRMRTRKDEHGVSAVAIREPRRSSVRARLTLWVCAWLWVWLWPCAAGVADARQETAPPIPPPPLSSSGTPTAAPDAEVRGASSSSSPSPSPSPTSSTTPMVMTPAAQPPSLPRMTLEASWETSGLASTALGSKTPAAGESGTLIQASLSAGKILEAHSWPLSETSRIQPSPLKGADGTWSLGPSRSGRVRLRVEAPLTAELLVRQGDRTAAFRVADLLDGPRQTQDGHPVQVFVERLSWDPIEVVRGQGEGDGILQPGSFVSIGIRLNLLSTTLQEMGVRLEAALRPVRGADGDQVWSEERAFVVATKGAPDNGPPLNGGGAAGAGRSPANPILLQFQAPMTEGTYLLELQATWEPLDGRDRLNLGRWLSKLRGRMRGDKNSAIRRVSLAVMAPKPESAPAASGRGDFVDLSRARIGRSIAYGRQPAREPGQTPWVAPAQALDLINGRRDLLAFPDLIPGTWNANANVLGAAGPEGLSWLAMPLKTERPGRPHRLTVTIAEGRPAKLAAALIAPPMGGRPSRVLLDVCSTGPLAVKGGPPTTISWLVWPDCRAPLFVVLNRSPEDKVRISSVQFTEVSGLAPPRRLLPLDSAGRSRVLALSAAQPDALDQFGAVRGGGGVEDLVGAARNLAEYAAHCGANALVLSEELAEPNAVKTRGWLDGQGVEDALAPNRLDVVLKAMDQSGLAVWLEMNHRRTLARYAEVAAAEAAPGLIQGSPSPLLADLREIWLRRAEELIKPRAGQSYRDRLAGLAVRLGPEGTLLSYPDSGVDDITFMSFAASAFDQASRLRVPGVANTPDRMAIRRAFLKGPGKAPWLAWSSRETGKFYGDLAAAVAKVKPGASVAVVTPGSSDDPIGQAMRQGDWEGEPPTSAWRNAGLDLKGWLTSSLASANANANRNADAHRGALIVLRGEDAAEDRFSQDLAFDAELNEQVSLAPRRGIALGLEGTGRAGLSFGSPTLAALPASSTPEGGLGPGLLTHAVGKLDAQCVFVSARAIAGREEVLREFSRSYLALPSANGSPSAAPGSLQGCPIRVYPRDKDTIAAICNDTPYPLNIEAWLQGAGLAASAKPPEIFDLKRQALLPSRTADNRAQLAITLAPYEIAVARINAKSVVIGDDVKLGMPDALAGQVKQQAESLRARLAKLSQEAGIAQGDPMSAPLNALSNAIRLDVGLGEMGGWQAGGAGNTVQVDQPRLPAQVGDLAGAEASKSGPSLRLDAAVIPASAVSAAFEPPNGRTIQLRAWVRADQENVPAQVWLEGTSRGKTVSSGFRFSVGSRWRELSISAPDLANQPLEQMRVRFDLLKPGRLWVSDISLTATGLANASARNACRDLYKALQAYREGRYADFARLADSRWVNQAGDAEPSVIADAHGLPRPRAGDAGASGSGNSSGNGLSSERRLR